MGTLVILANSAFPLNRLSRNSRTWGDMVERYGGKILWRKSELKSRGSWEDRLGNKAKERIPLRTTATQQLREKSVTARERRTALTNCSFGYGNCSDY